MQKNANYPHPQDPEFEEKFIETFLHDKKELINTLAGM